MNAEGIYEDTICAWPVGSADAVLYLNREGRPAWHEPVGAFDHNGYSRIDFAGAVWLFSRLEDVPGSAPLFPANADDPVHSRMFIAVAQDGLHVRREVIS